MSTRVYYRIILQTQSVLSIGAADSDATDGDVVLDSCGQPIIPAASLAGAYRAFFWNPYASIERNEAGEVVRDHREDVCRHIFGSLEDDRQSAVRVYDATLLSRPHNNQDNEASYNAAISIRDSVKLKDDEKTVEHKKKFDRQVVEAGARFVTYIEILDESRCGMHDIESLLAALHSGEVTLGSKTTRGFGRMQIVECRRRRFDLVDANDLSNWLDFDMFNPTSLDWSMPHRYQNVTRQIQIGRLFCKEDEILLHMKLKLRGGIAIREYIGRPGSDSQGKLDYQQLKRREREAGASGSVEVEPLVPGTSWTGALRARYRELAKMLHGTDWTTAHEQLLFGIVNEETHGQLRSHVVVSETELEGGTDKTITRNAIDRFTAGTIDGALYVEKSYWGGTTKDALEIRVRGLAPVGTNPQVSEVDASTLEPLIMALADMHNGFLAVGGLTAVGRGLFEIDQNESKVLARGKDVTETFFRLFGACRHGELVSPRIPELAKALCEGDHMEGERDD